MISRRNIRVKVMQTLYTLEAQEQQPDESAPKVVDPVRILQKHFDQSRQLLTYLIYFITEVMRYAETDSRLRASKHLPSHEDLNVNIKLAGNEYLWKILEDNSWKKAVETDKPHLQDNQELIRKLYLELVTTEEYKNYITVEGRERRQEKEMLEFIFSGLMLPNETFVAHVEELFTNWDDDGEMISQILMGYLAKPGSVHFQEIISKDKWEFAKGLLVTV
ncbi:MAG: transcription antitermination factor NusB, partial [Bacteroidetes bacterium]|nr:transcription antitermination factor NusB [Bacteroidota bacterium]